MTEDDVANQSIELLKSQRVEQAALLLHDQSGMRMQRY